MANIDELDQRLLRLLQKNARASNRMLAEAIGLSESACRSRRKRLEEEKHILGYSAVVSPAARGHAIGAWHEVKLRGGVARAAFETALDSTPNVIAAFRTEPEAYLINIGAPDMTSLEAFSIRLFETNFDCERLRRWLIVSALASGAL